MALSHEIFTDAQLNGPKTVVGYPDMSLEHIVPEKPKSVFEAAVPTSPPALIELLKLSERQGAYANLSLQTRRILQMRYVEGLNLPQIGDVIGVSKQAVSQTLRLTPESLYKKMTKDVVMRRTNIPFSTILLAYSNYRIELDVGKKAGK